MDVQALMAYAGMAATAIAAVVMTKAAWRINTAKVWKEEAEAQKARADRLSEDLTEIKERLTRIEDENKRLVELLTALDPERVAALRI
ncbi:hypothetical protein [Streptomyces graminilatus]|uniref:hypothetical protein n=1 Tax=Streptomyces graminilatus TaxID=1464070 RepID=UPI000A63ED25|nr:hypothetical protein [Streptomyces graminilatus]